MSICHIIWRRQNVIVLLSLFWTFGEICGRWAWEWALSSIPRPWSCLLWARPLRCIPGWRSKRSRSQNWRRKTWPGCLVLAWEMNYLTWLRSILKILHNVLNVGLKWISWSQKSTSTLFRAFAFWSQWISLSAWICYQECTVVSWNLDSSPCKLWSKPSNGIVLLTI